MKRDTAIDTLRGVALLLVVVLHVSAAYVRTGLDTLGDAFWTGNIINSFTRIAVPLFVMISGKYLLDGDEPLSVFFTKRFNRVGYSLLFWTITYSICSFFGYRIIKHEWNLMAVFDNLINGMPYYHLWYLFMLIGLYLSTPFLRVMLQRIDVNQRMVLGIVLLLAGMIIDIWDRYYENHQLFILWFVPFLGYYVMGNCLANRPIQKHSFKKSVFLFSYFLCAVAIALLTYYTVKYYKHSLYFYSYFSPLVILGTLSIYTFFIRSNIPPNRLAQLSKYALGVYLVHAGILDFFNFIVFKNGITNNPLADIIILFTIVLIPSIAITYLFSKIPLLSRVI